MDGRVNNKIIIIIMIIIIIIITYKSQSVSIIG